MRLLVTGGSGMLGSHTAARAAASGWETWATYTSHPVEIPGCGMLRMDVRDPGEVRAVVAQTRPDAVVHTSALVKPDVCERNKRAAFDVNAAGTAHVAAALESTGAFLVHVSTDLVFDGSKNPIKEDDQVCPPNYYGLTKAAAETAVRASQIGWAIVRTSVIYGPRMFPYQESFSDKIIESLREGKTFGAFVDQYRPAVPVWNLADVLLEIAERRLTGDYHAVCTEVSTRYQFARKVAEILGLDTSLIRPLRMDETPTLAPRPKMLALDTTGSSRALNTRLLAFEEGIRELAGSVFPK